MGLRTVPIQVEGRTGHATQRLQAPGHAKRKLYYFVVDWDSPETQEKQKINKVIEKQSNVSPTQKTSREKKSRTKGTSVKGPTSIASTPKPNLREESKPGNDEAWE